MFARESGDTFNAGTLAGAGSFRCGDCGFAVALHERDEVPDCPRCGGTEFRRASIFGELSVIQEPLAEYSPSQPEWIAETRAALDRAGDYVAYEEGDTLRVVALAEGWTRVGRSLSADIRFDDPTVSRRHAIIHREGGVVRLLDDRSLNGVFVDGERIEMRELHDGEAVTIGRFCLHFMTVADTTSGADELAAPDSSIVRK